MNKYEYSNGWNNYYIFMIGGKWKIQDTADGYIYSNQFNRLKDAKKAIDDQMLYV